MAFFWEVWSVSQGFQKKPAKIIYSFATKSIFLHFFGKFWILLRTRIGLSTISQKNRGFLKNSERRFLNENFLVLVFCETIFLDVFCILSFFCSARVCHGKQPLTTNPIDFSLLFCHPRKNLVDVFPGVRKKPKNTFFSQENETNRGFPPINPFFFLKTGCGEMRLGDWAKKDATFKWWSSPLKSFLSRAILFAKYPFRDHKIRHTGRRAHGRASWHTPHLFQERNHKSQTELSGLVLSP